MVPAWVTPNFVTNKFGVIYLRAVDTYICPASDHPGIAKKEPELRPER